AVSFRTRRVDPLVRDESRLTEKEAEGERREGQGEGEESEREGEEEDPLCQSTEDEVGKMLRSTLNDLETALEVRESRQVSERQEAQLVRERGRSRELQRQLEEVRESKEETISQLTSQVLEMKKSVRGNKERSSSTAAGGDSEEGLDTMTFCFLRQAVYHFLADIHPEDHLRSISSILKFTPQERKIVYSQFGERK
ncbi:hypothetical protein GBAR_LOCUS464, partial [Geodia barretti]